MGDPKFCRRKYDTPSHPWEGERIKQENELVVKYGLKNKKEIWKAQSLLRKFRGRARELQAKTRYGDTQSMKEMKELIDRLTRMGLLTPEQSTLDDVLSLNVETILSRRLQTLAYVKGQSYTPKQARQFIIHGHVSVGGRKVTIPSYMVRKDEEEHIAYNARSPIANDLHPARPKEDPLAEGAEALKPPVKEAPPQTAQEPKVEKAAPKPEKPAPSPEKKEEKPAQPTEPKAEKVPPKPEKAAHAPEPKPEKAAPAPEQKPKKAAPAHEDKPKAEPEKKDKKEGGA